MHDCVLPEDTEALVAFLRSRPRLTQGDQVARFEAAWSEWLGVDHSVYVNSGSSANLITVAALKALRGGGGEIVVSPLGWISDIAAVMHCGFDPVFADLDPTTLSMSTEAILAALTERTRAVLLTHVQGFDGLTDRLLQELHSRGIPLLEDVCESHGATHGGRKLGTFGLASNFSFYFAHHLTTVEGGMVCTDDPELYQALRLFRSHGMVRESTDPSFRQRYAEAWPELHPEFTFAWPAYNVRGTELGAVLGCSQLPRLDASNQRRRRRFRLFLEHLDPDRYWTDFREEGSCSYAFNLVLSEPDPALYGRVLALLGAEGVEVRRGSAGGGNQVRQPYLRGVVAEDAWLELPVVEHIHRFGLYFGNHDEVEDGRLVDLCTRLGRL